MRPMPESRWRCTYQLAQTRFPGMYNSLDALCKRYKISLAEREKHGALIDTRLLALVYLELQGGKERGLEFAPAPRRARRMADEARPVIRARDPAPSHRAPRPEERARHGDWLREVLKTEVLVDVRAGSGCIHERSSLVWRR